MSFYARFGGFKVEVISQCTETENRRRSFKAWRAVVIR